MIYYDDIVIENSDYNSYVSGVKNNYEFFELLRYSAVNHLSGDNIIGIAYYIADPKKRIRNYSHISYHKDLKDFFKTDDKKWSGIYNMMFRSAKNEQDANKIIDDIKSKHIFHH